MSVMSWIGRKLFGGGIKAAFCTAAAIFTVGACSMLFNQKADQEGNFITKAFEEGFDIAGDVAKSAKDKLDFDIT